MNAPRVRRARLEDDRAFDRLSTEAMELSALSSVYLEWLSHIGHPIDDRCDSEVVQVMGGIINKRAKAIEAAVNSCEAVYNGLQTARDESEDEARHVS